AISGWKASAQRSACRVALAQCIAHTHRRQPFGRITETQSMELLDRYLGVLRVFLPRRQRDDIVREISEEIHEQLLDKEMTLGRRLTVEEQAEVIGRYGHPLITAARYRPQQHLIGPIVFPYYWIALKFVLAVMLFGHAVSLAVVASN